jgi:hypothetical protein
MDQDKATRPNLGQNIPQSMPELSGRAKLAKAVDDLRIKRKVLGQALRWPGDASVTVASRKREVEDKWWSERVMT